MNFTPNSNEAPLLRGFRLRGSTLVSEPHEKNLTRPRAMIQQIARRWRPGGLRRGEARPSQVVEERHNARRRRPPSILHVRGNERLDRMAVELIDGHALARHGEWRFAGADYSRKATKWRCPTGECKPASRWIKADRLHPLIPRETPASPPCTVAAPPSSASSVASRTTGRCHHSPSGAWIGSGSMRT
jgi:hypothetical protein